MNSEVLALLLPAALTGILVLSTHVPLGQIVLSRGILFVDLAIAQVAGLGVVTAEIAGWEAHGWTIQVTALAAALAAALLLVWTDRRLPHLQEAIIGVVFVTAAAAEILLLSLSPHGAEHLKDLLAGQILWVTPEALIVPAILYAAILAAWRWLRLRERPLAFYGVFALVVTASVQLVGVLLVFASLVVPALWSRSRPAPAYAIGAAGYAAGLAVSFIADLPTGAAIVCGLVGVTGAMALVRQVVLRQ